MNTGAGGGGSERATVAGLRRAIPLLLVLCFLAAGARGVSAQGRQLRAQGSQALSFGDLLGGLPTTVPPTDPLNSGQIDIRGEKGSDVLVEFLLPQAMVGPGGAEIPLVFGPGFGGYSVFNSIATQIAFDPSLPQVVQLDKTGRGMLYLGGTATPPPAAAVGSYSGTISLTISYVGN